MQMVVYLQERLLLQILGILVQLLLSTEPTITSLRMELATYLELLMHLDTLAPSIGQIRELYHHRKKLLVE